MPVINGHSKAADIHISKSVSRPCLIGWAGVVSIVERYERGLTPIPIHQRTGMPLRIVKHICAEYEARFNAWRGALS